MNWSSWKPLLSVLLTTFAGGFSSWAFTHLGTSDLSSLKGLEGFGVGALIAGAAALAHLYQPVPPNAAARAVIKADKAEAKEEAKTTTEV